jgi:hypothetical protein
MNYGRYGRKRSGLLKGEIVTFAWRYDRNYEKSQIRLVGTPLRFESDTSRIQVTQALPLAAV